MNNLSIRPIRTVEEFINFREEWIRLETETDNKNLTVSYDWLLTWWKIFGYINNNEAGHNKELLIIRAYRNNSLVAILPLIKLYRKKIYKISFVEFLGQQWGATYLDLISTGVSKDDLDYIFDWIKKNVKYDVLRLSYIPEDSSSRSIKNTSCIVLSGCPSINLRKYSDFENYKERIYSKKLRQNIRTALNKMAGSDIKYECKIRKVDDESLREIIRLSASKLQDKSHIKHSIYSDPNKERFIRNICHTHPAEVLFITLNNTNVAYRLNILYNDVKYCLDASYDRDYPKYDLGTLSVHESIQDSFRKKLHIHCEGTGVDFYKLKFINEINNIYSLLEKGNTLLSPFVYKKAKGMSTTIAEKYLNEINATIG